MSEPQERRWDLYIADMIEFSERALSYTEGLDQSSFLASGITYDATLRNLELIGEAASRVPESVRAQYPKVPWRLIIATRNRLAHAYLGIDDDTVWSILQDDLPSLLGLLQAMNKEIDSD